MAIVKDNRLVSDRWQKTAAAAVLPNAPVLVELADWLARAEEIKAHRFPRGVILPNDAGVETIASDLPAIDLIVLNFPAFTDGRAYSQARQLREQYQFRGEIRASGEVFRDQINFMLRCGIDAFEINDQASLTPWQGEQSRFSHWYQPAADHQAAIFDLRHQAVAAE